jgi:peptidoglycan/xylan/chitin deacetylase (PgdA/CDA1 family)
VAPLLKEYSLPATVFIVAGQVGRTNAWGGRADPRIPTLPLLGWERLALLGERGVRLGAHTMTHPHLTKLPPHALEDELAGAAELIRRNGPPARRVCLSLWRRESGGRGGGRQSLCPGLHHRAAGDSSWGPSRASSTARHVLLA